MGKRKRDPYMTDAHNPPLDAKFWERARPAREVMGEKWLAGMKKLGEKRRKQLAKEGRGPLGRPRAAKPKVMLSLRLDADVVAGVRASGPGYNVRVEKLLRAALARGRL